MPPDEVAEGGLGQEQPEGGGGGGGGRHEVVADEPGPRPVRRLVHVLHHREQHVGTDPARVRFKNEFLVTVTV